MAPTVGPFSTALEMLAALDAREISSVELVELHLQQIDEARCRAERDRGPDARPGARGARGAPTKRGPRASGGAPRAADDAEGVDARRGAPSIRRHRAAEGLPPDAGRPGRAKRLRRGRMSVGQDEHPRRVERLAGRQPGLRTHQQPVGSDAHAGGQHGRWLRSPRRRDDAARDRERHRWLDPRARRVLRRVRPPSVGDGDPPSRVLSVRRCPEPRGRDGGAGSPRAKRARSRAPLRRGHWTGRR